jgi:hypothetical protein
MTMMMMTTTKKLAHHVRQLRINNTRCGDLASNWREPESISDRTFFLGGNDFVALSSLILRLLTHAPLFFLCVHWNWFVDIARC